MPSPLTIPALPVSRPVGVLTALLGFILLLLWLVELQREPYQLPRVEVDNPGQLVRLFADHDYAWPPQEPVPPLGVTSIPPGMNELGVEQKKTVFFRSLLPLVLAENDRLREQRSFIEQARVSYPDLDSAARERLESIVDDYKVEGSLDAASTWATLLRRVDVVPPALVLAQAANESGWGTSRFTVEANNLFGVWTYDREQGLKPRRRAADADHYVRIYPNLQQAVRDYLHNLNIGHAYESLRRQRAAMRANGEPLNALILAGSLVRYSERGAEYVGEIRGMIRSNGLNQLGKPRLAG